jgi:hypothetical protein
MGVEIVAFSYPGLLSEVGKGSALAVCEGFIYSMQVRRHLRRRSHVAYVV